MRRVAWGSGARLVRLVMAVLVMGGIVIGGVVGVPAITGGGSHAVMAESADTHSRIAAGYAHTLLVDSDGVLWAWGRNTSGELGVAAYDTTDRPIPTRVHGTATNWESVAASWYHSFGIRSDGTLWAWGENEYGQLGIGYQSWRATIPQRVGTASNWAAVSAGHTHTLGLRSDGTLWVWGSNLYGQLGSGAVSSDNVTSPVQLGTGTNWVAIAAGDFHSLAVRSDGTLWAWGYNNKGQLGLGSTSYSVATPTQVTGDVDWARVDAEYDYSMGIDQDGDLYSWGNNYNGILGLGNSTNRKSPALVGGGWRGVYPGRVHCLGVRSDGSLYGWGSAYDGALGLGEGNTGAKMVPTLIMSGSPAWVGGAAGDRWSVALRSDGTVWGFGWNGNGQLGLGDANERFVPTLVSLGWPLSVTTLAASGIAETGATLNGILVSLGSAASVEVSFQWGPTASYGSTTAAQTKTTTGAFSAALTGLAGGTTYYYRATVEAGGETVYGEGKTFSTATPAIPPVAPSVTTGSAGTITTSTAILRGSLASAGTAGSLTVSFEYGTEAAPYSQRTPLQTVSAAGDFTANLTGLASGTTYYYRARADGDGTARGSGLTFTTQSIPGVSPVVDTLDAEAVTASSARLNGHLASLGEASSVELSFQWGTISGSYPSESAAVAQSSTGAFFFDLTGLAPGTTYYFRTRAMGEGTSLGEERSFTTEPAADTGDGEADDDGSGPTGGQELAVTGVEADSGKRGQSLTVTISGSNLVGATAVSFGSGITVEGFTVDSSSRITADIVIAGDAEAGAREVSVTTGAGTAEMADGFSVTVDKGGFCDRGTASAGSEVTVSMTALGLVLGTGYWITKKRAK